MQQALRNRLSKPIDDDRGDNPRGIEEKLIVTPGERVAPRSHRVRSWRVVQPGISRNQTFVSLFATE
jgi:hypothetical protein